jgi:hypothetical protein
MGSSHEANLAAREAGIVATGDFDDGGGESTASSPDHGPNRGGANVLAFDAYAESSNAPRSLTNGPASHAPPHRHGDASALLLARVSK